MVEAMDLLKSRNSNVLSSLMANSISIPCSCAFDQSRSRPEEEHASSDVRSAS